MRLATAARCRLQFAQHSPKAVRSGTNLPRSSSALHQGHRVSSPSSKPCAVACASQGSSSSAVMVKEHSSQCNSDQLVVTHNALDLDVDFDAKTISGSVEVTAKAVQDAAAELILDTSSITVHEVNLQDGGGVKSALQYKLAPRHKVLGSPLVISLPEPLSKGKSVTVSISYTTSPEASALQWLEPVQTAGQKLPYLFTQCQAIHARSLVPCQDTPSVKSTYSATVRVAAEHVALMSAVPAEDKEGAHDAPAGRRVFKFNQPVPIPSYLLALAVGDLESRRIGPRSQVWSEPSVVDAAAYEFANTDKYLTTAEKIAGPYVWGIYDLLLLPPSFPYGGMENPCCTYVTPTLLAGDRSLDRVVCHEIAHSWTGNLVSCATWEHFWLNEGCTMFLERKIVERLDGDAAFQFGAAQGYQALADAVRDLGADNPFTQLVPDLSGGIDPDDAFSRIPYEKGFYFLVYLQTLAGKDAFEPWFRKYLETFRLGNVSSEEFKELFLSDFGHLPAVKEIDWDTWFFGKGMPPAVNTYDTTLGDQAIALAKAWHTSDIMGLGTASGPPNAAASNIEGWGSEQVVLMLDTLIGLRGMQAMHPRTTRSMNSIYKFDDFRNSEVRCSWYRLCLSAGDETVFPLAAGFLEEQGRMKFTRPLYRALFRCGPNGKALALQTFQQSGNKLHPIARKMVASDLGVDAQ